MIFLKEDGAICLNDGEDIIVFPLLKDELSLLLEDQSYFENYLNLKYEGQPLDEVRELFALQGDKQLKDPDNWVFHAVWVVASIKYKAIVGSIIFNDRPDSLGNLDIEYVTAQPYRRQGMMTTAVSLILGWAFDNNIMSISATTPKDNVASIRVLEKNNFLKIKEENGKLYFRKDRVWNTIANGKITKL